MAIHNKKKVSERTAAANAAYDRLAEQGYVPWNDHPGYTIDRLNTMLEPHGLKLEAIDHDGPVDKEVWVKLSSRGS